MERAENEFISHSRKTLRVVADFVTKRAEAQCREVRRISAQNAFRLASLRYVRQGADFAEVWQDGTALNEVAERLAALQGEKEDVERQRKAVAASRRRSTRDGGMHLKPIYNQIFKNQNIQNQY